MTHRSLIRRSALSVFVAITIVYALGCEGDKSGNTVDQGDDVEEVPTNLDLIGYAGPGTLREAEDRALASEARNDTIIKGFRLKATQEEYEEHRQEETLKDNSDPPIRFFFLGLYTLDILIVRFEAEFEADSLCELRAVVWRKDNGKVRPGFLPRSYGALENMLADKYGSDYFRERPDPVEGMGEDVCHWFVEGKHIELKAIDDSDRLNRSPFAIGDYDGVRVQITYRDILHSRKRDNRLLQEDIEERAREEESRRRRADEALERRKRMNENSDL